MSQASKPIVGVTRTLLGEIDIPGAEIRVGGAKDMPREELLGFVRGASGLVTWVSERVDEGHSWTAVFKILLFPMLFLETERNDVTVDVRAHVLDVRNGLIYTTFDDHRTAKVIASVRTEDELNRVALDSLFEDSIEEMRGEVGAKLRALETQ